MVAGPWYQWVRRGYTSGEDLFLIISPSVDAQWITAKKDWQEAKRRHKMHEKARASDAMPSGNEKSTDNGVDSGKYEKDMDEMRCILYSHGGELCCCSRIILPQISNKGGYYFGSVDQER